MSEQNVIARPIEDFCFARDRDIFCSDPMQSVLVVMFESHQGPIGIDTRAA